MNFMQFLVILALLIQDITKLILSHLKMVRYKLFKGNGTALMIV